MINFTLFILILTCISMVFLLFYIFRVKHKTQLHKVFIALCLLILFWLFMLILQILLPNINPLYFDYFIYISICFLPIAFLLMGLIFTKTKITLKKKYLLLAIIPVISLLVLWTNDYHHLFYVHHSINLSETVFGPYFYIHSIYTYLLFIIGLVYILKYSIKNSGFFSNQAILFLIGSLIPISINILGYLNILPMTIYMTPISFAFTILFFALAIFKFNFLKIAPIALQNIVDSMSDAYIVLNNELIITDFNKTLMAIFDLDKEDLRNTNIFDLIDASPNFEFDSNQLADIISETKLNNSTVNLEMHFKLINKYLKMEVNSIITSNGIFLGTLILFKDVTQHNLDLETIRNTQEMLVEKERLSSLGQMIGGIAHNLKTPIMSIAGAMEGLSDLIKEYDMSIGDSDVTIEDHHEIAKDMTEWVEKTRTHLSYMSDIITAIKGQAVAFSDNTFNGFTVEELVKHVDILMKHELKNALINLKTNILLDESTQLPGNINSLVQVINNIISNAIQAYNGNQNEDIIFNLSKKNNKLLISIQDFAGGLPEKVQEKLFKEMITTKGKNGTGLGLFMSYSNIKAHFNGTLSYKTIPNDGTTFFIEIPIS